MHRSSLKSNRSPTHRYAGMAAVARDRGIVLYVPALAVTEVAAVYPDAENLLSELLAHRSRTATSSTPW